MAYTPTRWVTGDKVTSAKLNKIENGIADKVDKVSGKALSTNDYTNTDKKKVDDISISSPINGQALVYNSSTQKWENKTISSGGSGQDGYSPTITVTNITGGHRVSITDVNGTKTFDVMDGTDGTNGTNGTNGTDGVSPTVTVTNITNGHRVSITDATGTKTFDVMNGSSGEGGSSISIDNTLTVSGAAADAKTVGDRLSNKVDVVSGKSLSTNDYTNLDKQKLDSISVSSPTDGQVLAYNSTTQKWVNKTISSDGGGDDSGQDSTVFIGNTPLTLTEDTNIELVATEETTYAVTPTIVASFADRTDVVLNKVTFNEGDGYYEFIATNDATSASEAYASATLSGLTVGTEYALTITPQGNADQKISGGAYGIFDGNNNLIKYVQTGYDPHTEVFTATTESIRLQIYPAGAYFWEQDFRTARFTDITIIPNIADNIIASFADRTTVVENNATLTEGDGYYEIGATESATAFNEAYVSMYFGGLTVGKNYAISVTPQGNASESISGGNYIFTDANGGEVGEFALLNNVGTLNFTATTESIRLRLYPTNAYLWNNGYRKARLQSLTIVEKTGGSFTGTVDLGVISAGVTITSTPSCAVYKVTGSGGGGDSETTPKSRLAGKVLMCLGDSVTGFMPPPTDYPSTIAKETGMTVYNCGFAGCRMSDTHPNAAYRVFGMTHLADAIATGDWSEQDANVSGVEAETYPQQHLNNLKNVNWNNVDFITIFYGANDAGNGVPFGDSTGENIQTFIGALNYSVRRILTAYPKIKIMLLTPIYRYWVSDEKDGDEIDITIYGASETRHYYAWGDALIDRAKVFKLPYTDMYRTLGINTWTWNTYLKNDGAHPTALGNELIGCKIAARLLSEY